MQHIYKYFISSCLLIFGIVGFSQEKPKDSITLDSISYKTNYGLRLGIDISKPILAQLSGSYSGIEIVADYRINKRFYAAAELGYEEETSEEDFTNSTSKGSYIRLGFNFNAYENWLDMNNEIFVGYRYGFALFDQTLNSYTPNTTDFNNSQYFPANPINVPQASSGLTAHWSEFVVGLKAETFKNFFVGFSISYKIMMSNQEPINFKTLYAPGFNRVFESSTGFGFNYTISYLIPFKKK